LNHADTLQSLETQLASLKDTIDALKTKDKCGAARSKSSKGQAASRGAGPSKGTAAARPRGSTATKKSAAKKGGRRLDADAILTFEEKKELSETIQNLDGPALEDVIAIIHAGVPEIGDNTDEIEIEIDALPPQVLRSLWNAVIKPKAAPPAAPKPPKNGRQHAATGGLKRKSMDEVAEAEKMRELEARISMFNGELPGANGAPPPRRPVTTAAVGGGDADSVHSSDSESDSGSDSSDSD